MSDKEHEIMTRRPVESEFIYFEVMPVRFAFFVIAAVVGPSLAIEGFLPWSWALLVLPFVGIIIGYVFRYIVRIPRGIAAAYQDNRFYTRLFAVTTLTCMLAGIVIALSISPSVEMLMIGWMLGTLAGGLISMTAFDPIFRVLYFFAAIGLGVTAVYFAIRLVSSG